MYQHQSLGPLLPVRPRRRRFLHRRRRRRVLHHCQRRRRILRRKRTRRRSTNNKRSTNNRCNNTHKRSNIHRRSSSSLPILPTPTTIIHRPTGAITTRRSSRTMWHRVTRTPTRRISHTLNSRTRCTPRKLHRSIRGCNGSAHIQVRRLHNRRRRQCSIIRTRKVRRARPGRRIYGRLCIMLRDSRAQSMRCPVLHPLLLVPSDALVDACMYHYLLSIMDAFTII